MVVATEEVKLLKTLVSDLEKELKTKGERFVEELLLIDSMLNSESHMLSGLLKCTVKRFRVNEYLK